MTGEFDQQFPYIPWSRRFGLVQGPDERRDGQRLGLAAAGLPERLDHWQVLEIGPSTAAETLAGRGAAKVDTIPWPIQEIADLGSLQLAYVAAGLDGELHPLSVGAWLWWLLHTGGMLVFEATVLADPAQTAFAEFVADPR